MGTQQFSLKTTEDAQKTDEEDPLDVLLNDALKYERFSYYRGLLMVHLKAHLQMRLKLRVRLRLQLSCT